MGFPRAAGILLDPTSLPGPYGIGDLGDQAHRFVEFLAAAGQRYWQMLPLGPTDYGNSPYQSPSAFAGNLLFLSPEKLVQQGLLDSADLGTAPSFSLDRVAYDAVRTWKRGLFARAHERFKSWGTTHPIHAQFEEFCNGAGGWLDDFALFRALKEAHGGKPWDQWEPQVAQRDPAALQRAAYSLRDQVERQKFTQFLFQQQWSDLRRHAADRGVKIIGDIPIFVAYDSADVWTYRHLFKLDANGAPLFVAGVPPDMFSATGQRWGNPVYDWQRNREESYQWWTHRMQATLARVDMVRVDHFRGFAAYWEIPAGDATAEHGHWEPGPGKDLFTVMEALLGKLPVIAEDLGFITPDVESLRDELGYPGMCILQFGFGGDAHNKYLPHNYPRNVAAYTGTHDNDTMLGWFRHCSPKERAHAQRYLDCRDESTIPWTAIRVLMASAADTVIIPLQDVLALGSDARMNIPGTGSGDWAWRFRGELLTDAVRDRLRAVTELYGRAS